MDMEIVKIISRFEVAKIPMQITVENNEVTVDVKLRFNTSIRIKERTLLEALRKMEKEVFEWREQ